MRFLLIAFCLIFSLHLHAEDPYRINYKWDPSPIPLSELPIDQSEPEVILRDFLSYEFNFDDEGSFTRYVFRHKIIVLNSDEAIERNNRIYLPVSQDKSIFRQEARVIRPDGTTIELNEDDIKEATDETTERVYKYFALEGLTKGSRVEYIYLANSNPIIAGSRVIIQEDYPIAEAEFELLSPTHLVLAAKSYNGFPQMQVDTNILDMNCLRAKSNNIPAAEEEVYALFEPNLQQVVFKFQENMASGMEDMFTYQEAADHWTNNTFTEQPKTVQKGLKKLSKSLNLPKEGTEIQNIRAIENQIKDEFQVVDYPLEELSDMEYILENKMASESGILKLFAHLFDQLEIPYEVVFTANRYDFKFDPKFQAYNFIEEDLLYFPQVNDYVVPADMSSRIGLVPPYYTDINGVFIKRGEKTEIGWDVSTQIKKIEADSHLESTDTFRLEADLRNSFTEPSFKVSQSLTGHNAQTIQIISDYLTDEEKVNLLESMVKNLGANTELDSFDFAYASAKDFGEHPLKLYSEFKSSEFTNPAGEKYLFKIGELIGPQVEMYQEGKRDYPIDMDYNHLYYRELKITIPEEFTFSNLNSLKMEFSDDDKTMLFKSDYRIDGKTLTVKVTEYYSQTHYPIEMFETFRSVINAAADFNKITLVIQEQ
jgi:hypothetical protein